MTYIINHIHLKSENPRATADWFIQAFNCREISDSVRAFGGRLVVVQSEGALNLNFSGARPGEVMAPADPGARYGLEHFGFDSTDIVTDINRLVQMGATLIEGPIEVVDVPLGPFLAFIAAPGGVRIELIQRRS